MNTAKAYGILGKNTILILHILARHCQYMQEHQGMRVNVGQKNVKSTHCHHMQDNGKLLPSYAGQRYSA
jgi:hypothetical protein